MIYSILYILLNVTLYIDIGVARALYVAVAAHSKKNINILLYVSLCAPYFVIPSSRSVILNATRCHSEYTLCHSERSEESRGLRGGGR